MSSVSASLAPGVSGNGVTCGDLLREARRRRRLSQLELALKVGASQRHLSFVETGRATASRGMLIALADALGMSPAGCNQLLLASGFAPRYTHRPLADDRMAPVRSALDHLLSVHDPLPAWVLDPAWNVVQYNRGADRLVKHLTGRSFADMPQPVNLLEAMLHPQGLRPHIENFDEVAAHLYHQTQAEAAHLPALAERLVRVEPLWPLSVRPGRARERDRERGGRDESHAEAPRSPVLSARVRTELGLLSFFSMVTTFGSPLDITVASLRIEHQFAADARTRDLMRDLTES